MNIKSVYVDAVKRFSLDVDEASGRTFVSIPVSNSMVDYVEWYEVDRETFGRFEADPALAHDLDHLLLLPPGTDRGDPT